MPTQKLAAAEGADCLIHNGLLGAAGVGDEHAGADQRIEVADGVDDPADGLGQVDPVGGGCRILQRGGIVYGADVACIADRLPGTDT